VNKKKSLDRDKTIQMWDVQKRKLIASALEESGGKLTGGHTGYISALCVVPGVCLVSGSYDHLIKVRTNPYNTHTKRRTETRFAFRSGLSIWNARKP
jgi:WD40 repeat protein